MTNFLGVKYNLLTKERYPITALPAALKKKADVFGSVFALGEIEKICSQRKLIFAHQIKIRPDTYTCVLVGYRLIKLPPTPTKETAAPNTVTGKKKEDDTVFNEETIKALQTQLRAKKESFSLVEMDQKIKNCKHDRNLLSSEVEKAAAAVEIKKLKQKRWSEYQSAHKM